VRTLQQVRAHQAELEAKREELEQIQAMRDQFIASVSHELRTPMNAILGFNELLLSRIHDRPEALKVLNHTRHSADHLMTVINDVLDYSQLQSGTLVLHPETFNLRESVQNAVDVLAPKAASQGLDYRCELEPTVPTWVHTDRHRMVQVLVNLLGNALKFTARGQVVLSVQWLNPGVEFSVQDTGIGIPANKQHNIFRRFAQADSTIAQRYGGNGLGLAISRRLVELLGGDMGFESREGFGSRFWFRLPLAKTTTPPTRSDLVNEDILTTQAPWRFLVVDDHPVNRVLVNRVLKASWPNAHIREVADGVEALAALQQEPADAVFMDMLMPHMDGITCTERIRQTLPTGVRDVVVFGLTANVNPEDLHRFRAAGLDGLMLKPFDWRQLCAETERLLLARQD
jgi:CheY-like chemotaxis protein/nitrogen-specific signal transduction histidine kinase